jgi:hypothetical protein
MGDRQGKKLAIFGAEDAIPGIPVSLKPAGPPEKAQARAHPGKKAVEHGYIDKLALSCFLSTLQRSQDADGRKHPRGKISDGYAGGDKIPLFILKTM